MYVICFSYDSYSCQTLKFYLHFPLFVKKRTTTHQNVNDLGEKVEEMQMECPIFVNMKYQSDSCRLQMLQGSSAVLEKFINHYSVHFQTFLNFP